MAYNISGDFYEACDCEVICSCWAGVDPDMGACTGLWVWQITSGTIGTAASGIKVAVLNNGKNCNQADHAMVFVDLGSSGIASASLVAALTSGSWKQVMDLGSVTLSSAKVGGPTPATIVVNASKCTIQVPGTAIAPVIANWKFPPSGMLQPKVTDSQLVRQATGAVGVAVDVGQIVRDANNDALNMLVASNAADGYIFDLDITGVTAMKGTFHYVG